MLKRCRICDNDNIKIIMDLGNQVLSCRFPLPNDKNPPSSPLVLVKCDDSQDSNKCGLVQLSHNTPSYEL